LTDALRKISQSKEWNEQYLDKFLQVGVFVSGADFQKEVEEEYAVYKTIAEETGLIKKK
jgi:tripartite-type tricarboxylate transporter receptor subunit TctC